MPEQQQYIEDLLGQQPYIEDLIGYGQQGPGRIPALLSGAALGGVATAAGVPGDLESLADKYIFGKDPATDQHRLPTSAEVRAATTDKLGMTGPNALVRPDPANALETWGSAAAEGAGSGLLLGPLGTIAGAAGGVGSEVGHQVFPTSTLAPVIGGLIGGGLVGGAQSLLKGSNLDRLADSLGSSSTLQEAGSGLQSAARGFLANLPQRVGNLFKDIDPSDTKALASANAEAERLMNFTKGPLAKIVKTASPSAADPNPEVAAQRLLVGGRTGGSDLAALRAEFPDEVSELGAAHLRSNPAGWTKLSPEAQAALAGDPKTASKIFKAVPAASSSGGGFMQRALGHAISRVAEGSPLAFGSGLIAHYLGGDPLLAGAIGEAAGMAMPWATAGAKSLVTNPLVQRGAFAGATAGRNPLVQP